LSLNLEEIEIVEDFTINELAAMAMADESWESDPAKRMAYVRGMFMSNASIL